jgi:choline dehydrogenase-like flavoprotein
LLIDARSIPQGTTVETDLCIIGAGAAGITLALECAGGPFRVCLLESGGFEPDPETQALSRGRVFGRAYYKLESARVRRFGGSTSSWQGICRPLESSDFEARDWVPHSGWPFGAEVLRSYYERAQERCRLEAFGYDGQRWASAERPLLAFEAGVVESRVFQIAPVRFGEVYRKDVTKAPNVDTFLFANVVELEASENGRIVERVAVACLAGNRFSVRARLFILATGGIENARLLLASNRVQRAGLGNPHDLVGRFFMEHPHVISAAFLASSARIPLDFYRARPVSRAEVAGLLTLPEETRRRERMLSFGCFPPQDAELPEFEVSLARMIREMDGRPGAAAERAVLWMGVGEQVPNPESRVRLADERDALGMPRVQLEWRLGALDKRSLRRAHEILAREFGRAGLGRLQLLLGEDDHQWPPELSAGRHHMGTTRMHQDPRRGVVDPRGRVHGLANLYLAGSSVFPTSGAAGPTLTLVALALRLADDLKEVLQ